MNNIISIFAMTSMFQFSNAKNLDGQNSQGHLLMEKTFVIDPKDFHFKLVLNKESTKSILEQLKNEGLLDEGVADLGPWCE